MSERVSTLPEPFKGRYEVQDVIAHGDIGIVYRATDMTLESAVVIKVISDRFAPDSATVRQFINAARIVGQLQHPNIPSVYDVGTLPDGRPFFVQKLICGRTVQDLLDERPDRSGLVAVFEQVCQAIAYAHAREVAHGNLTPAHVMVGAFGEVQVIGWGAARVVGGSSPGAADVGRAAFRSDVFGLGEMLGIILTGRNGAVERLGECGADSELVAVARRCLSPDSADRLLDPGAVAALVTSCRVAAEQRFRKAEATRAAAEAVVAERLKRRRVQLALAVSVTLLIAASVALAVLWRG